MNAAVRVFLMLTLSHASAQYLESTIPMPDGNALISPSRLLVVPFDSTIHVGSLDHRVVVVDPVTLRKIARYAAGRRGNHVTSMCYNSREAKVYVGLKYASPGSSMVVVDASTRSILAVLPAGDCPEYVTYNPVSNKVYCAPYNGGLGIIDGSTNELRTRLDITGGRSLAFDSARNWVYYLTNEGFWVIDGAGDNVLGSYATPGWYNMCYNPTSARVYVGVYGYVVVMDPESLRVGAIISVGSGLCVPVADPVRNKVFCAAPMSSTVTVVDCAGDSVLARLFSGGTPHKLVLNPTDAKVYSANESGGSVTIIDAVGNYVRRTDSTGRRPYALCYDEFTNRVFCADRAYHTLTVIDGVSDEIIGIVPRGDMPALLLYSPLSDKLYCTMQSEGTVVVVDGATNTVIRRFELDIGSAELGFNHTDNKVYCPTGRDVAVIDGFADTVATVVPLGFKPRAFCYNSERNWVYCAGGSDGKIAVIDGQTDTIVQVIEVGPGTQPKVLCYNPKDNRIYCGNTYGWNESFDIYDGDDNRLLARFRLRDAPKEICFSGDVDKVIMAVEELYDSTLWVFDGAADTLRAVLPMPGNTSAMAVGKGIGRVFVADGNHDRVVVVDVRGDSTHRRSIRVGRKPVALAYDSTHRKLYSANQMSDDVMVVDVMTLDTLRIKTGLRPYGLAWNPNYNRMYVANLYDGTVSVIRDTTTAGIGEGHGAPWNYRVGPTLVHGILPLTGRLPAVLLDISGRKVMDLLPGENDVRHLSPGVYFVRQASSVKRDASGAGRASSVRKVILTR